jgi:hypothetical protein
MPPKSKPKTKTTSSDETDEQGDYTGCIKKKVIELQRAMVSELLCV